MGKPERPPHALNHSLSTHRTAWKAVPAIAPEREAGTVKQLNWTLVCAHGMHCRVTIGADDIRHSPPFLNTI
jgi:hypothetical protein